jgi:hypothetical protein
VSLNARSVFFRRFLPGSSKHNNSTFAAKTRKRRVGGRVLQVEPLECRHLLSVGTETLSSLVGDGRFLSAVDYSVGSMPTAIVTADIDRDGITDMAVANLGTSTVSILLGNDAGVFHTAATYSVGQDPESLAIGDVNEDGYLDIVTANQADNTVSVLLGKGNGVFASKVDYTVGDGPNSVAIADLDGDGHLDIITAAQGWDSTGYNQLTILFGKGNGTFSSPVNYAVGVHPGSVAVGDLNGDGKLDIVATDAANGVSVLLNNGDGTFGFASEYSVGARPMSVALADLNGDGNLDIITTNIAADDVSVLLGKGNGTFGSHQDYTVGFSPVSLAVGDVDGDGYSDIFATNAGDGTVSVLLNQGDGTFAAKVDYAVGGCPESIAVADFNDDGKLDVVAGNFDDGTVSVLLQSSSDLSLAAPTYTNQNTPTITVTIASDAVGTTFSNNTTVFLDVATGSDETFTLNYASATIVNGVATFVLTTPLADGTYFLRAHALNAAGENVTSAVAVMVVDITAPTLVLPTIVYSTGEPSGTVTATDSGSGLPNGTIVYLDADFNGDGVFSNNELNITASILLNGQATFLSPWTLSEGVYSLRAHVADQAGNVGYSNIATVVVDKTAPTISFDNLSAYVRTNTPTILVDASDALAGLADQTTVYLDIDVNGDGVYEETVSGELNNGVAAFTTSSALPDGTYFIRARVQDQAGNEGTSEVGSVTIDTTAPTATIGNPSSETTAHNAVSFVVTLADDNLDLAASALVASDIQLLTTGDAAGVVGVSAVSRSATKATYLVTVSNITGNGSIGIKVAAGSAADQAGNVAAAAISNTFRVDNTAPTVRISQAAAQADPTNASTIYFTVVFSEAVTDFATGDVLLSGAAGATAAVVAGSGTTYTVAVSGMTAQGSVVANIAAGVAHDAAGNANTVSTNTDNSVFYDATTPTVGLTLTNTSALPSGTVTAMDSGVGIATGATVYVDANVNGTWVQIATATLVNGTASFTASTSLNAGTYTFRARVSDAVGNQGMGAVSQVAIGGATISNVVATAKTSADKTTIAWSESCSTGLGNVVLTIDGKSMSVSKKSTGKTTANFSYSGVLSAGTHSYTITAYDGKKQVSTATGTFSVSATQPTFKNVKTASSTSDKNTTISWTVYDIDNVSSSTLMLTNTSTGATISTSSGIKKSGKNPSITYTYTGNTASGLTAGTYSYIITAADSTGVSATKSGTFTVKATTPMIKNVKATTTTSSDASDVQVVWTVFDVDGIRSTTLKIDDTAITSGITSTANKDGSVTYAYMAYWSAGKHSYTIDAVDASVSTVSAKRATGSFTVKASTPALSGIAATGATSTTATTIVWNAMDVDGIKTCTLTIDGKAVSSSYLTVTATATSGTSTTAARYVYSGILSTGKHTYAINVVDSANMSKKVSGTVVVSAAKNNSIASYAPSAKVEWILDYDGLLGSE